MEYSHGMNWRCGLCGTEASIAEVDRASYECPNCRGLGIPAPTMPRIIPRADPGAKAVTVPEIRVPEAGPLRFRDSRFGSTGIKTEISRWDGTDGPGKKAKGKGDKPKRGAKKTDGDE